MGRMICSNCEVSRRVIEPREGLRVEKTGALSMKPCCWYCGSTEPKEPFGRSETIERYEKALDAISQANDSYSGKQLAEEAQAALQDREAKDVEGHAL